MICSTKNIFKERRGFGVGILLNLNQANVNPISLDPIILVENLTPAMTICGGFYLQQCIFLCMVVLQ
jgi:hypothetical protein